jgi:alpha-D-ribose 1-methylphosphonate 5-triphosphate synthase subunit PhnG
VRQLARSLCEQHQVQDIQLPQSGLALLKLRDSAQGDAYYPGEVPLAIAHVRVTTADGSSFEGAAQLLDDRASLARAIAVLDAVLAARLSGHEAAQALLATGAARLAEQAAQRRALLASTRVDFSLLGTAEDENDDE